jgi:hypothetical protein
MEVEVEQVEREGGRVEGQQDTAQEPTPVPQGNGVVVVVGAACVVGGVSEEKEGSSGEAEMGPMADNGRDPEGEASSPLVSAAGASVQQPVGGKEYIPGGAAMRAVCVALRDALDCVPVALTGLEDLVEPLLMVEAWAQRACQGLKIKIPTQKEREAEERRNPK